MHSATFYKQSLKYFTKLVIYYLLCSTSALSQFTDDDFCQQYGSIGQDNIDFLCSQEANGNWVFDCGFVGCSYGYFCQFIDSNSLFPCEDYNSCTLVSGRCRKSDSTTTAGVTTTARATTTTRATTTASATATSATNTVSGISTISLETATTAAATSVNPIFIFHNTLPSIIHQQLNNKLKYFNDNTILMENSTFYTPYSANQILSSNVQNHFLTINSKCNTQYRDSVRQTFEQIDLTKRIIEKFFDNKPIKTHINILGGQSIDSSLSLLRVYKKLGVSSITLAHGCNTPWLDKRGQVSYDYLNEVEENSDSGLYLGGLTDFGGRVVREMNRLGLLVDASGVSSEGVFKILKISSVSVMVSSEHCFLENGDINREMIKAVIAFDAYIKVRDQGAKISANSLTELTTLRDILNSDRLIFATSDYFVGGELFKTLTQQNWSETEIANVFQNNLLNLLKTVEFESGLRVLTNPGGWDESWISQKDIGIVNSVKKEDYVMKCRSDFLWLPRSDEDSWNLVGSIGGDLNASFSENLFFQSSELVVDCRNNLPYKIRKHAKNQLKKLDLSRNMRFLNTVEYWNPHHTDLSRMSNSNLNTQFFVASTNCYSKDKDAVRQTTEQIDLIHRLTEFYHASTELATSTDQINSITNRNKLAVLIGVSGGHTIGSSLEVLRVYQSLGVRYLTITDGCYTSWADTDKLSLFGIMVVMELNRLGVFVDLSGSSDEVIKQVFKISKAPVIFSHSNVKGVFEHSENIDDNVLNLVKQNQGVIMLTSSSELVGNSKTVEDLAVHAKYIKDRIGFEHIGMGANLDDYPMTTLSDFQDVSGYEGFWKALRNHGFSEPEISGVKGGNLMRAMGTIEEIGLNLRETYDVNESRIPIFELENVEGGTDCRT